MKPEIRKTMVVAGAAATLLAITMGSRSSLGLFVWPLNAATGLGLIMISAAVATNQLLWGAAQPFVGAISERYGPYPVIVTGGVLLGLGTASIPFALSGTGLVAGFAVIAIAGAAAGSSALLIGEVSRRVSMRHRGLAIGVVGAGGSAGQLVLGPGIQGVITAAGWEMGMIGLGAIALITVPAARVFRNPAFSTQTGGTGQVWACVVTALASRRFWYVTGGFMVCGFHVAFLVSHMPGVIEIRGFEPSVSGGWLALLGLFNVAGSVVAGVVVKRRSMRQTLMWLYALRAIGVALFLVLPNNVWVVLGFAVWMGLTYMATLPPTAGLIGKLFGLRRMATLLGIVMFFHQIGAFLGVWLGGIVVGVSGSYDWIWYADIVLAVAAMAIHLPLGETAERAVAPTPPVTASAEDSGREVSGLPQPAAG